MKDSHAHHRIALRYGRTTHCADCRDRWLKRNPKPRGKVLIRENRPGMALRMEERNGKQ